MSRQAITGKVIGHGASDDAKDPSAYSLPGHARAVRAVLDVLGVDEAHFVGWSLGGHVALEMAPDLRNPCGFVIFGTPPLTSGEAMSEAFFRNPAMQVTFQDKIDSLEASAYVAAFFRPGFADIPPFFLDDVLRTDGRARSNLGASVGEFRDECAVVRDLRAPLAVLHGDEEQLVNGRYFDSVAMPTLWRSAVQMIPDAGHTPQWETPKIFDARSSKPSSRRPSKTDSQPTELRRSVGPWLTSQWARICRRRSKR